MKAPAYTLKKINKKKESMFKDISVWQCCRKQEQNYLNVGRGGVVNIFAPKGEK